MTRFDSRAEAGRRLAEALRPYAGSGTTVCGIPPGGAIVAAVAATELGAAYECMVLCKITMPCFPDLVLGTLDADGNAMFDPSSQLTTHEMMKVGGALKNGLAQKVMQCRGDRSEPDYAGRTVIVVDEVAHEPLVGMGAAAYLRRKGAVRLVFASPAIGADARGRMSGAYDAIVGLTDLARGRGANALYAEDPPTEQVVAEHLKVAWAREAVA